MLKNKQTNNMEMDREIIYICMYVWVIPRNDYNMAKIRGTVRGSEGGTVRGWRSKK